MVLYIANKNYSSWSLRPWVLLTEARVPFEERLVPFRDRPYSAFSPSRKVPCLHDGDTVVWDSLAIVEYVAETHPGVWPTDRVARAWARSACAEMHSGFSELRSRCSMSVGVRMRVPSTPALQQDLERLDALWRDGLTRFGGPFLAGATFTAADAFFAPVAFRIQTYGLQVHNRPYVDRLLALPSMRRWNDDALRETFRDVAHESEILAAGQLLEDLRAPAVDDRPVSP